MPFDLRKHVPFYLASISYRLGRNASRSFPVLFGLNQMEWQILAILASTPLASATDVSEISCIDKAAVSRGVRRLEELGLVAATPVASHNRKRLLALTPAGEAAFNKVSRYVLERERTLMRGISSAEQDLLVDLLRRIYDNTEGIDQVVDHDHQSVRSE